MTNIILPLLDPLEHTDKAGRLYYKCPTLDETNSGDPDNGELREPCPKAEANLVSSLDKDGLHRPVIDLDYPHKYIPSTTDGHGHLYLDLQITWEVYEKLLIALEEARIIQPGFLKRSQERKATFVRPEWVTKPTKPLTKACE